MIKAEKRKGGKATFDGFGVPRTGQRGARKEGGDLINRQVIIFTKCTIIIN